MPKTKKQKLLEQAGGQAHRSSSPVPGNKGTCGKSVGGRKSTNRIFKEESICAKLAALKREYRKHYYFSDDSVIDLVLGIVAGNHFDSDPIWLHLISPPSGGKTELLMSTFECEETYFLSDFTAASLISGYKNDDKDGEDKDDDFSLLPKLNGKTVVTKDFSIIHDKPAEARAQILSILRDVYDGYASRALGNSKAKGFHSRFNYLTGMTPDIEKSWNLNTLGERFLMYRIQVKDRREHARRSLMNANKSGDIRKNLQTKVKAYIEGVPKNIVPELNDEMRERVLDLADLLSICRTYVHRERNDDILFLPQAELASRVAKQLLRIGQSVALVRGRASVTTHELELMKQVALDSLPTNRRLLVSALWRYRKAWRPLTEFETATGLSKSVARREIENLRVLKVVQKEMLEKKVGKRKTQEGNYKLVENLAQQIENIGGI